MALFQKSVLNKYLKLQHIIIIIIIDKAYKMEVFELKKV